MNTAPEPPKPIKGHCPNCGPGRLADVVGRHGEHNEHDTGVWTYTDYHILKCRGCETVYFQTDMVFSEDEEIGIDPYTGEEESYHPHKISYWPAPSKRSQPDWASELIVIDRDLASLFDDIYVALNNDLGVLSAIGIRTAFDRASELLGVDPAKKFAEKLTAVLALEKIGLREKDRLDVLIDAGSAAAHRGWKPDPNELKTMMDIIETFFENAFILDPSARRLRKSVPKRKKAKP